VACNDLRSNDTIPLYLALPKFCFYGEVIIIKCDRMTPQYTRCPFSEMIVPKSLLDFDFFEIWSSWEFDKAFELQMDKKTYKNYYPCEECRYLGKECFPCPVYYQERNVLMNDCSEIWGKINEES
jgi:hypothetical protein